MCRLTDTEENARGCKDVIGLVDMISKQFKRHFPLVE